MHHRKFADEMKRRFTTQEATNQLENLDGIPLTDIHWKEINGTPFARMKELALLKLQPGVVGIFASALDP